MSKTNETSFVMQLIEKFSNGGDDVVHASVIKDIAKGIHAASVDDALKSLVLNGHIFIEDNIITLLPLDVT